MLVVISIDLNRESKTSMKNRLCKLNKFSTHPKTCITNKTKNTRTNLKDKISIPYIIVFFPNDGTVSGILTKIISNLSKKSLQGEKVEIITSKNNKNENSISKSCSDFHNKERERIFLDPSHLSISGREKHANEDINNIAGFILEKK
ncbi:hypothetical protein CWI38_0131p0030 [Hamiltosporidium tvaerminnensis]|uniref:Uncharacterized protein n=1 Tax=Hamiltosporidium tvaerminnensis TaxID=1176355 RepID=A0A4Q9M291_9MICR|nr:hypothetical protein CWI38_0168p0030 [Hamiltosporidium tvaerminnensis]TBU20108.1 hypothetical protein CWI38_0131p0030 [Hamiltosporidium tvaerminnensis]